MKNESDLTVAKKELKAKYQPLWDKCINSFERHKVKTDFYSLKSIYSERFLDVVWESITYETRMRIIRGLDISALATLQEQ